MKIRILFLFLFAGYFGWAQKTRGNPPNTQMKQMEKELKELEKDNPEMAKKIREMMKQKQLGKKTPQSSVSTTKFVSPVTPITVKLPVAPPGAAQATDRLLWFKGKKIDAFTLITTGGTLIRYNKAKNEAVVQPSLKKDPFTGIVKELSKTEQQKNEFIREAAKQKNSFFFYPAIINTLKEYDNITERYKSLAKNTLKLPPPVTKTTGFSKKEHSGYASYFSYAINDEIPEEVRKLYNELLEEMKNAPPLDFTPPPSREFDVCFDCDSNVQKKYYSAVDKWAGEFLKYERGFVQKTILVQKEITDIRNVEAEKMWQDMNRVNEFAFSRIDKKIEMLQEQYGKDFSRVPAIIQISLSAERQKQLLGLSEDGNKNAMQKIISMMDGFDEYLQHQMDLKNYNTVFNLAFIIGMERQKQLLGAGEENGLSFLDKFWAFNRFKMSMDMDFDLVFKDSDEQPVLKATGATGTTQNVYMSLGLIDCKFQLFLTNTSYENAEESEYRIPLSAKGGTKSIKDEKDRWVTYSYSGPKEMLAIFPATLISFCNNSQPDSMYVQIIRYKTDDLSVYAKSVQNAYTIDFLAYANNLFATSSQLLEATDEMKNFGMEMMQVYSSSQIDQPMGDAILDKMQNNYNLVVKQQQLQSKLSEIAMMPKTLILFDAKNNDNTLIDAETNTAHKDQQMELTKGIIKVKVVHDPLPYNQPLKRKPLKK